MAFWRRWLYKSRNFIRSTQADLELEREIASHLGLLQDDFVQRGMTAEDAFWAAKRAYGGVEQAKELHRDERSWVWLEQFWQDVRFAARGLLKSRGLTITSILTLAFGIGANTAIFSLIDSVMLKALPVSHPEQLLQVNMRNKDIWGMDGPFLSNSLWEHLRDRQDAFSGIFAYALGSFNLVPSGEARYVQGNYASGQFFETLGLHPLIGRTFTSADDQRSCSGVAILGYNFWQSEYAGNTSVLGHILSFNNHPFEIVGVTRPGFTGVDVGRESDVYVPLCTEKIINGELSSFDRPTVAWLRVIGRPKPGISAKQAEQRIKTFTASIIQATLPPTLRSDQRDAYLKRTFETQMAENGLSNLRGEYQQALSMLMVITGVVLLIACANVAHLLLARGAARQKEIAVRLALGSGRWRLMRQLLTESMMLSLSGAALGIAFARWGARLLVGLLSTNIHQENRVSLDLSIDSRVLAFTAGVTILTSLLFGLAPAWRGTQVEPLSAMKANARGVMEGGGFGLGRALVVLQVACSLLLVAAAGLMVSTFFRLETLNPGFEKEHILLADVTTARGRYTPAERRAIFERILEHLRALPGVRSASYSDTTPIDGAVGIDYVQAEGTSKGVTLIYTGLVSGRFFETLGMDLLAGRDFNSRDTLESPKVAIVNQALARKFFPGQNPIGKLYRLAEGDRLGDPVQIVGLVKNAKALDLREDIQPTTYVSANQDEKTGEFFAYELRATAGSPASLISVVKSAMLDVNPNLSLKFKTLAVQLDESLARERLLATLSGFFGVLALLLAMIGLYGVTSFSVTRRRNEIGIRMALGAQQSGVLRTVVGEIAILVGMGLAIGLVATIGATRLISSFLYGVKANDPWILSIAAAVLASVALLAGFLPARRASRIDPMSALREE